MIHELKMPEVLEGSRVKLIPLIMDHAEELWESAKNEDLWSITLSAKWEVLISLRISLPAH